MTNGAFGGCRRAPGIRRRRRELPPAFATDWDLAPTQALIESYRGVAAEPVRRLVNTHHNGDNFWGNQLFRDAVIIGHRPCAKAFGKDSSPVGLQMLRSATGSADVSRAPDLNIGIGVKG